MCLCVCLCKRESSSVSSYRGPNPKSIAFMTPCEPHDHLRATSPNAVILGFRASIWEFRNNTMTLRFLTCENSSVWCSVWVAACSHHDRNATPFASFLAAHPDWHSRMQSKRVSSEPWVLTLKRVRGTVPSEWKREQEGSGFCPVFSQYLALLHRICKKWIAHSPSL